MKKKVSIALSTSLLAKIDRCIRRRSSRSAFIESILREHFQAKKRQALYARELRLINANAARLNREAEDILKYQAPLD